DRALPVRRPERRHVRRRRWGRRAEQVLEDPLAADDRRGAVGIRSDRQYAAVAEEPATRVVGRQPHAPEVRTLDVRDAVVARDALVQERVIGAQQIERTAVLAHDAAEEKLRLP